MSQFTVLSIKNGCTDQAGFSMVCVIRIVQVLPSGTLPKLWTLKILPWHVDRRNMLELSSTKVGG